MKWTGLKRCMLWMMLFLLPTSAMAGRSAEDAISAADVGRKIQEALQAVGEYSAQKRDIAAAKVKDAIEALDARIERLEEQLDAKWEAMDQTSRENIRRTMKTLQEQRRRLAEWYGGLKHGSAGAWEQVKKGLLDAFESLKRTFDQAEDELEGEHMI